MALFSLLGLGLESLHGLKVGAYLDVGQEPRRLMWTLAHTHGTLMGLVHLSFAATVSRLDLDLVAVSRISHGIGAAGVLLPLGFFLGGLVHTGTGPGAGAVLVPVGALALVLAAGDLARRLVVREEPG